MGPAQEESRMSDDKMQMTKEKLPPDIRKSIERLIKGFDPKSQASITARTGATFTKLERPDALPEKK
jgi:hypothetical protein